MTPNLLKKYGGNEGDPTLRVWFSYATESNIEKITAGVLW